MSKIKEWKMDLRENKICLDEYNVDVKKEMIDCEEQSGTETCAIWTLLSILLLGCE